jgi:restriction system protein
MKAEPQIWAIRAGRGGKADHLFFESKVIALEDDSMGDLACIDPTRDCFKRTHREEHQDASAGGSANIAGKYFRFCLEIAPADTVLYYRLADRHFYVGKVTGAYRFEAGEEFPHQRPVKWIARFPKENVSVNAQRELGAARTFFRVSSHSDEITRVIKSAEAFKMEFVRK